MVDESTDIFVSRHLVVFAIFLEDSVPTCVSLGLLNIPGGKKDAYMIYELILTSLNQWGLDLDKFVGCGSNGTSVITGIRNEVVVRLEDKVNPFIISIHCIAHRTNIASLDPAISASCKNLSTLLDDLINDIASHFKRSSKVKSHLNELQEELYDAQRSLKIY